SVGSDGFDGDRAGGPELIRIGGCGRDAVVRLPCGGGALRSPGGSALHGGTRSGRLVGGGARRRLTRRRLGRSFGRLRGSAARAAGQAEQSQRCYPAGPSGAPSASGPSDEELGRGAERRHDPRNSAMTASVKGRGRRSPTAGRSEAAEEVSSATYAG